MTNVVVVAVEVVVVDVVVEVEVVVVAVAVDVWCCCCCCCRRCSSITSKPDIDVSFDMASDVSNVYACSDCITSNRSLM